MFSKECRTKSGATVSNKDHIQQEKCICCHKNSEAGTAGERLLVKISMSVTNSEAAAQRSSVKKVFLEILQSSQ